MRVGEETAQHEPAQATSSRGTRVGTFSRACPKACPGCGTRVDTSGLESGKERRMCSFSWARRFTELCGHRGKEKMT
jgi:hypothetical protein